jgi:hypothetical protein
MHHTGDECKAILRHGHIIPMSRGCTKAYRAEHCPGWSWNELVEVFKAAGIFVRQGASLPTCDDRVAAIYFSSPTDFSVEWVDGARHEDDATPR